MQKARVMHHHALCFTGQHYRLVQVKVGVVGVNRTAKYAIGIVMGQHRSFVRSGDCLYRAVGFIDVFNHKPKARMSSFVWG